MRLRMVRISESQGNSPILIVFRHCSMIVEGMVIVIFGKPTCFL